MSEKMIVPNQQKEENFLMKVSRPPTSNKRPTTNHLQKSPNRGHRVIYVKKDVEQRPSTTSSIVPQYKTPRYLSFHRLLDPFVMLGDGLLRPGII